MSTDRPNTNERETISEMTTGRLSVYLRCLTFLESIGQKTVSSAELADRFHLNSAQIRKDLACFGEFGTRGVGYKDRKSTRLNSSHPSISYAVFCLKQKAQHRPLEGAEPADHHHQDHQCRPLHPEQVVRQ